MCGKYQECCTIIDIMEVTMSNERVREEHVRTGRVTADGKLGLDYTMRPDNPHNPLRYDFRWVEVHASEAAPPGKIIAGPFAAVSEAYLWQAGYDYAAMLAKERGLPFLRWTCSTTDGGAA